jgi:hypothetical protein
MAYMNNKGDKIGSLDTAISTTMSSRSSASTMPRPSRSTNQDTGKVTAETFLAIRHLESR